MTGNGFLGKHRRLSNKLLIYPNMRRRHHPSRITNTTPFYLLENDLLLEISKFLEGFEVISSFPLICPATSDNRNEIISQGISCYTLNYKSWPAFEAISGDMRTLTLLKIEGCNGSAYSLADGIIMNNDDLLLNLGILLKNHSTKGIGPSFSLTSIVLEDISLEKEETAEKLGIILSYCSQLKKLEMPSSQLSASGVYKLCETLFEADCPEYNRHSLLYMDISNNMIEESSAISSLLLCFPKLQELLCNQNFLTCHLLEDLSKSHRYQQQQQHLKPAPVVPVLSPPLLTHITLQSIDLSGQSLIHPSKPGYLGRLLVHLLDSLPYLTSLCLSACDVNTYEMETFSSHLNSAMIEEEQQQNLDDDDDYYSRFAGGQKRLLLPAPSISTRSFVLQTLDLGNNDLYDEGLRYLSQVLQTGALVHLKILSLQRCGMTHKGFHHLWTALATATPILSKLQIDHNLLGDKVFDILLSLPLNRSTTPHNNTTLSTLQELSLVSTGFSRQGAERFVKEKLFLSDEEDTRSLNFLPMLQTFTFQKKNHMHEGLRILEEALMLREAKKAAMQIDDHSNTATTVLTSPNTTYHEAKNHSSALSHQSPLTPVTPTLMPSSASSISLVVPSTPQVNRKTTFYARLLAFEAEKE